MKYRIRFTGDLGQIVGVIPHASVAFMGLFVDLLGGDFALLSYGIIR